MPRWTPESRLNQAAAIRRWTPWTFSTGPVTAAGKEHSSRNAWKGGLRRQIRNVGEVLKKLAAETEKALRRYGVNTSFCRNHAPRPSPQAAPAPGWAMGFGLLDDDKEEADDELDAIDRMSVEELMAAMSRLRAAA